MTDATSSAAIEPTEGDELPLYRRVLGARFNELPVVLRQFHQSPEARARGEFQVVRGAGLFRNGVASLMGLPAAGDNVRIELDVAREGNRERWTRHFDDHHMETIQWASNGLLIEAAGPLRFGFELLVAEGTMRFEGRRAWCCGVPLPGWMAPRVSAEVRGTNVGWSVAVEVTVPGLGMMLRYAGSLRPEAGQGS